LYIEDILFWIGYSNSMINPFLYNFTNHDFRKAFKDLLKLNTTKLLSNNKNLRKTPYLRPKPGNTFLEYLRECLCFRCLSNLSSSRSGSLTSQHSGVRKHTSTTEEETRRLS
jgi:hypothetical protein